MDNITHTLTGALAAKLITTSSPAESPSHERTVFWLLVLSANLPDIDVAQRFFDDYLSYIIHHRSITHSILLAPVFALLPAVLFYRFSSLKKFNLLWLFALIGILIHIFFDLITSFGTMLFAPLSDQRYALDWMFIIDPFFTGLLALALLLGRIRKGASRGFARLGGLLAVLYLVAESFSHRAAIKKIESATAVNGISPKYVSALPQPLNIFRWSGLVQTNYGVEQAYFSVFDDSLDFDSHVDSTGDFVEQTRTLVETNKYLTFARHPWINARLEDGKPLVELRDLQFSMDPHLLKRFGITDAPPPFLMRYEFSSEGTMKSVVFDGKIILD